MNQLVPRITNTTLQNIYTFCSASQKNADLCNDYGTWNYQSIKHFNLPLTSVPALSNTGGFMAPIDRFKVLIDLLKRLHGLEQITDTFVLLRDFPDLFDFVLVYGIYNLHESDRITLSHSTIRFLLEHAWFTENSFLDSLSSASYHVQKEIFDSFYFGSKSIQYFNRASKLHKLLL